MSSPIAGAAEVEAAMLQMLVDNTAIMKDGEAKLKQFLRSPAIVVVLLQLIDGSANASVRVEFSQLLSN